MSFNSFNTVFSNINLSNNYNNNNNIIQTYKYSVDASLVYFYPFNSIFSKNGILYTPNYAYEQPYMNGVINSGVITKLSNTYITGLADLSLNNIMGGSNTSNYVKINESFNLNPSGGLSISFWFACNAVLYTNATLCSLLLNSLTGIEIDFTPSDGITFFNSRLVNYGFNMANANNNVYLPMRNNMTFSNAYNSILVLYNSTLFSFSTVGNYSAIYFNGSRYYYAYTNNQIPTRLTATGVGLDVRNNNFTIGYWVYCVSPSSDGKYYHSGTNNYDNRFGINSYTYGLSCYCVAPNTLYLDLVNNGITYSGKLNNISYFTNKNFINNWIHVVYTFSGNTPPNIGQVYINGNLSTTTNYSGLPVPLSLPTSTTQPNTWPTSAGFIGCDFKLNPFTGYIRQYFIANSILSASDINNIYNYTKSLP